MGKIEVLIGFVIVVCKKIFNNVYLVCFRKVKFNGKLCFFVGKYLIVEVKKLCMSDVIV